MTNPPLDLEELKQVFTVSLNTIKTIAFQIPPPNIWTPQIIQHVIIVHQVLPSLIAEVERLRAEVAWLKNLHRIGVPMTNLITAKETEHDH